MLAPIYDIAMKMSTLTRVARAQEGPKAKMLAHLSRLCPMMNAIREQLRILLPMIYCCKIRHPVIAFRSMVVCPQPLA